MRLVVLLFVLFGRTEGNIDNFTTEKSRPKNGQEDGPLKVFVGMYIESIGNFRSTEMSFDIDLYLYQTWKDDRLAHNYSNHILVNDINVRNLMWLPDLYFANARTSTFQEVTVPNFNIFIARDGTISYSLRATCAISCSLDLVNYPMDHQHCYIRLLSYAHVSDQVDVHWFRNDAILHNSEIGLPEFKILNVSSTYCNGTYRYALSENSHKIGNFSCLMANIFLSRSIGYNLVQSYIPTGLIVMISWVSFFIDRRAVPARVTLSFTTLVSLTTLASLSAREREREHRDETAKSRSGNGLRYDLPQVSYAKAIDLWYGACLIFVFCALLEFAIINSYMRKSEKYKAIAEKIAEENGRTVIVSHSSSRSLCNIESTFKELPNEHTRQNGQPVRRRIVKFHPYDEDEEGERILAYNGYIMRKQNGSVPLATPVHKKSTYANVHGFPDKKETPSVIISRPPPVSHESSDSSYDDSESEFLGGTGRTMRESHFYTVISINASRSALKIDKFCRVAFPVCFVLFNLAYWCYYLLYESIEYAEPKVKLVEMP